MPTKAEIQAANNKSAQAEDTGGDKTPEQKEVPHKTYIFNDANVRAKIQLIEENVNKVIGKKGQNPHFWLNADVQPLVKRYLAGEKTAELEVAILALPDAPPSMGMTLGMTEEEQRKKYAELQREQNTSPIGLLMPKH